MRIVTWNVNSIRRRIERVLAWVDECQPDVLLLQETKCDESTLPTGLASRGFVIAHHGAGGYNGVAIASRVGLADVDRAFDTDGRLLSGTCGGIRVHSIYAPNGRKLGTPTWHAKVAWLHDLGTYLEACRQSVPAQPVVIAGDWNVTPADIDIYDPSRWRRRNHASVEERGELRRIMSLGLHDIYRELQPEAGRYSWWNYQPQMFATNRGLRIDFHLVTDDVVRMTQQCWVDISERAESNTSDHAPVVLDLAD